MPIPKCLAELSVIAGLACLVLYGAVPSQEFEEIASYKPLLSCMYASILRAACLTEIRAHPEMHYWLRPATRTSHPSEMIIIT
jgi:hypothetical protein